MGAIKLSKKYRPLFEIDEAKDKATDKKLKAKERKYYKDLAGVHTFIVTGGRGSAKSFGVSLASCSWAVTHRNKILYTRYTLTSTDDSIKAEIAEKIDLLNWRDYMKPLLDRVEVTSHKDVILDKGQRPGIVFRGIKTSQGTQTANLKSLKNFSRFIVEEGEELPSFEEWEKISLSIRRADRKNVSVIILNPSTKTHWIYEKFFLDAGVEEGFNGIKNGVCYIHTTYQDVPREFIPDEIYQKFEAARVDWEAYDKLTPEERETCDRALKKNALWFKHVVLGGWLAKAEGVVFEEWDEEVFPEDRAFTWGLDYGFDPDPTALVKVAIDSKRKVIYLKEYCYHNGLSTDQISDVLSQYTDHDDLIVADSAEKRLNIELIQKGHNIQPSVKGAGSIKAGIKMMKSYRIVVDPSSVNLKLELDNYVWNDKRAGIPVDEFNHLIDAARYNIARQLMIGELT